MSAFAQHLALGGFLLGRLHRRRISLIQQAFV
jgi:hypothetical protein